MEANFAKSAYRVFLIWGVFSSFCITVCTLVEAVMVGNLVGSDGLAVVSIATPIFLVYALFGLTFGVGSGIMIGRRLGASDVDEANRLFSGGLVFCAFVGVLCTLLSAFFGDEICRFLGAKGDLFPLAKQYLTVVFLSAPLFIIYQFLSVSVRTDGDPKLAALASAIVIVTNITLNIVFMRVLGWGIVGASASLCIATATGIVVLLFHFVKKHSLLRFQLSLPKFADLKSFAVNGFGVGSAYFFGAVVMLVFNVLLLESGNGVINVAIFGIIYTMSMVSFAVFDGAGNAVSTVVSIFAGEKDGRSMFVILRQGISTAVICGALITLAFLLCADWIVRFFGLSGEPSLTTAAFAFQIFSVSIIFTGINTVLTSFWQTIGRAKLAGTMSVIRNFVLMLVLGVALISRYEIVGVGITYVCSELLCLAIGVAVMFFNGSKAYVAEKFQSPSRIYEKYYSIETESIAHIASDLDGLCEHWDVSGKQRFFINLIVEELLINIIKFGLADSGKKCYIAIKLLDNDGEYIVRIRDNVRIYNPFDSDGDDIDRAAIKMITKKAKYYDYQRKLIFNYLYLII